MIVTNLRHSIIPNNKIQMVDSIKYLGITFYNRLKFDDHINDTINRARKKNGLLKFLSKKN